MDELLLRQQQEIATLRERVRQLEAALAPADVSIPVEWSLTAHEARVFAFLATRELATKEAIMTALYSDRPGEEPEIKIVDVFICRMRKKLKPFGVDIHTVWGRGYGLAGKGAR